MLYFRDLVIRLTTGDERIVTQTVAARSKSEVEAQPATAEMAAYALGVGVQDVAGVRASTACAWRRHRGPVIVATFDPVTRELLPRPSKAEQDWRAANLTEIASTR